jgi:hypothetical protein
MLESLAELRLPWLWILYAVAAIWGVRSALKRDHRSDFRAMQELSAKGIDLEAPREIEFAAFVRTDASAKYIASQLEQEGYVVTREPGEIEVTAKAAKPEKSLGFLVKARKVLVIYGSTLKDVRARLTALASKEDGHYLGWQVLDQSPHGRTRE